MFTVNIPKGKCTDYSIFTQRNIILHLSNNNMDGFYFCNVKLKDQVPEDYV